MKTILSCVCHVLLAAAALAADAPPPLMGWSSWNTYRVNINEQLILKQARLLVELGLKGCGYDHVNVDDGFFGGRDQAGRLKTHPERFPNGLKGIVDGIHSLGLKAGIYSDGGANTCGSFWDKDKFGIGVGFYLHDNQDADYYFREHDFDFIKVDFCGGDPRQNFDKLALDERQRYTAIRRAIDAVKPGVRMNICRWDFPGTWAAELAESWRISHDIRPRWSSVKDIIKQNLYLGAYASPGHYNDMDMLEVGRGMTEVEDHTHFATWCFMSSPLLIGCDLEKVKTDARLRELLADKELIALNQDTAEPQGTVVRREGEAYVLARDVGEAFGTTRAVLFLNLGDAEKTLSVEMGELDLEPADAKGDAISVSLPPHGAAVRKVSGSRRREKRRYEAETAYLPLYQELRNADEAKTACYREYEGASGGVVVSGAGGRAGNDIVFRRVWSEKGGEYELAIAALGDGAKPAVAVNGVNVDGTRVKLRPGVNEIRLSNSGAVLPEIDYIELKPGTRLAAAFPAAAESVIQQGANVAPNGDRLDVTSKCLRLNGRALVPVMGEMHYSRVPRDEWAKSLATMKAGGVSIVSTYVFWNHHEWKEGEWDFSGNRDLSAFLREVKKAGLWAVVRIGPWAHGECREGGFPDWLVDKAYGWANGDAKKARQILRSRDARFLGETKKLFERVHSEVAPHLWKNGGPVIGIQLENESHGPWPYYQALKKLAVDAGFDVPMYTRTGWPRLNGPETTFGEMIPLYGDYAEGFWDRELKSMPGSYKSAFEMRPARTSSVIATEQLGKQKAEDAKGAEQYPYFTCELGGGMASSYHRRLVMEPMDAFALAVVKLGSGSNLPGFYMYHGGSNPTEYGVNMAESQRDRFTNWNDLPVVSYEFMAPISEFGEPQYAYWMIKALADFCSENAEELAVAEPVFVNKNETRRGRFIFHNDYVRRLKPDGECWIGVEKDGKVERLLDGRVLSEAPQPCGPHCPCVRGENLVCDVSALRLVKPAGTPPPVRIGPAGVAMPPDESVWDVAAEYEVPFKPGDTMLEIGYEGDMARLYADGVLVQDDFWKGRPLRYALRRLPKGTKRLVLKVLPRGAGWEDKIYVDRARAGSSADDIARYEAVGELARDPAEKPVDAPKDMKLVLCMGQYNMAGRAKMSDADRGVVPRAYKLDRDGRWVAAKAPYHFDKTVAAVGPVDEFVRRYLADHPGESIGVVPCAVGGSPFYSWNPPPKGERKGVNYAKALERAKIAQANGKFIAILWHQGETDAAKAKDETGLNESYPRDFARMMSELRRELGEGDIPVIAGEIGRWMRPDGDHAARINPGIGKIPSLLHRSAVVSSEGLSNQDRHHFDREAQRILGGRYYDAFKSL